jgi:hypothetical protein
VLGHSHALSGAVAGIVLDSLVRHEPAGSLATLCGLTAAFALAPDIDQCGSTDARSLGFVTEALAWVIRKLSGGTGTGRTLWSASACSPIALAPQLGAGDRTGDWAAARDEIRAAILERGWNEQAGAFTQAFGSEDLDASSLMLAITGFLPDGDPRMKAIVDAIAARLIDKRGLVYRYLAHDGLAGASTR